MGNLKKFCGFNRQHHLCLGVESLSIGHRLIEAIKY
jgi:hypothetical protein